MGSVLLICHLTELSASYSGVWFLPYQLQLALCSWESHCFGKAKECQVHRLQLTVYLLFSLVIWFLTLTKIYPPLDSLLVKSMYTCGALYQLTFLITCLQSLLRKDLWAPSMILILIGFWSISTHTRLEVLVTRKRKNNLRMLEHRYWKGKRL